MHRTVKRNELLHGAVTRRELAYRGCVKRRAAAAKEGRKEARLSTMPLVDCTAAAYKKPIIVASSSNNLNIETPRMLDGSQRDRAIILRGFSLAVSRTPLITMTQ